MNHRLQALLRLFAVQGTWNYERMLGVGMGYAAEPLLEDLKAIDPVRHGEAVVRSAEFFNCHPNLAGLALGATARAEYEGVPGVQIVRLRTALCSPLGSLGDQLFWAGLLPSLLGITLAALVLGAPWWVIIETTGRSSGRAIHTPLARGPMTDTTLWLVSVHGRRANFVKNLVRQPAVRVKHRRRWLRGRATVEPLDAARLRQFNLYARSGPRTLGIDPVLVRVDLERAA